MPASTLTLLFASSSGTIDVEEWHDNLRKLGIDVQMSENRALFMKLDADASGELTLKELQIALKGLQDAAIKAEKDEKAQAKLVGERRRAARAAQQHAHEQVRSLAATSM